MSLVIVALEIFKTSHLGQSVPLLRSDSSTHLASYGGY